jgi:hypothetical protein
MDREFTLYNLLHSFRNWKSSDDRDRVFALCNLATARTRIPVDYSKSVNDVYLKTRKKLASQSELVSQSQSDWGLPLKTLIEIVELLAETLHLNKKAGKKNEVWAYHIDAHGCQHTAEYHDVDIRGLAHEDSWASITCPGQGMIVLRDLHNLRVIVGVGHCNDDDDSDFEENEEDEAEYEDEDEVDGYYNGNYAPITTHP